MSSHAAVLAMSRSGRFVAVRRPGALELIDALGTAPRFTIEREPQDFAFVGGGLWVLDGASLHRFATDGHATRMSTIELAPGATGVRASSGEAASSALVLGARPQLVVAHGERAEILDLDVTERAVFPLAGRRVLVAGETLRVVEVGRGDLVQLASPERDAPLAASYLFGGRAIALLFEDRFVVLQPGGQLVHQIVIPAPRAWAIAESRGSAVLAIEDRLLIVDLRYGRVSADLTAPLPIRELAIDAAGQFVALVDARESRLVHLPITELVSSSRPPTTAAAAEERAHTPAVPGAVLAPPSPPAPDAASAPVEEPAREPAPPIEIPTLAPRALGEPLPPLEVEASDAPPYASPREHVDELIDVVATLAARAIADAWNSGRLSVPSEDRHPFEREVLAIVGGTGGFAGEVLSELNERVGAVAGRAAARAAATLGRGSSLPWVDLARELGLSAMATQILAVVLAPQLRGELARLYGVLANDEHRPLVDRFLVETVIAGDDRQLRATVASELAPDAPLLRFGLIHHDGSSPLFGALEVDPVVIDRVCGRTIVDPSGVTTLETAPRAFRELQLPAAIKRELVLLLARPRSDAEPLRLVLRGRAGSGRTTAIASLAAEVGFQVASIDAGRLPRDRDRLARQLRVELARARLSRAVPVVSGLEISDAERSEDLDAIRQVLRAHPGPLVLRTRPESTLPLDPGYQSITIPATSEAERAAFWADAVARAGVRCSDVAPLAQRFRIGPGTIERIVAEIAAHPEPVPDHAPQLDAAARQHVTTRLARVATRITRLARWEQVSLPGELLDSLKELIARLRHRRTVYEDWGFDAKMTTSRGLSALFYGAPGTGKSMVAGLIARELGLDLYRVDLARVVSKWIGETEKNLAEIFDAAEDGQVVVLFDEADSLFAKRGEVKSSNDRYANLEVNYLLQRLDTFEGVCILTTNLDGSIDPAFKRRMSVRLQFPFPDEETRAQLWAAHIPPEAPVAGSFDFAELARRFPLSGGYIRNSVLRAAFLAAQEARPLSQEHLVRAVHLEYRELGKLSTSGRID